MYNLKDYYKNRKILVTGHTGFKGSWMCETLLFLGAEVYGYSLKPPTNPNMFELCELENRIHSYAGDIRDLEHLRKVFEEVQPEVVIHMAAQPIVRESYKNPVYTYDVNVMGTVNVLENIRLTNSVKTFANVTTDKVYRNFEWERGYNEEDILGGFDPYSNSKSCSELVTECYRNSFFSDSSNAVAISTCRAGNVIGGGDFAADRIIPDCIRAVQSKLPIIVRNPYSTRPYQHVLEPVMAYLMIAMEQALDLSKAGNYNIGPDDEGCLETGKLVDLFCNDWNKFHPGEAVREDHSDGGPHEANYLKLDNSKIKVALGWKNIWNLEDAVEKTVEWTSFYMEGKKVSEITQKQIEEYISKNTQK